MNFELFSFELFSVTNYRELTKNVIFNTMPTAMLSFVIGFAACQSKSVEC